MSQTSSTYTFTTCRILHPSDQLTSSSALSSCPSSASSPPAVLSAPHTPCCTPRRLSLSPSLVESSTNLRDSTKTSSTSLGLERLLLERGISASACDRGPARGEEQPASGAAAVGAPPNPPRPCCESASACPDFQFSPSDDDPPYFDTFLASKPARVILREVLSEAEREGGGQTDDDGPTEALNLRLVEKLKGFRTLPHPTTSPAPASTLLAPFCSAGLGSAALGLNTGLRRNRSYPAVVIGASMAMKDPGGPPRC